MRDPGFPLPRGRRRRRQEPGRRARRQRQHLDRPRLPGAADAPDGRKYKPLFAPLIVDLDNRVNLNVHGNLHAARATDARLQPGLGPWEVNLGPRAHRSRTGTEWTQPVRRHRGPPAGRPLRQHGHRRATSRRATARLPAGRRHFYAQVDFDGTRPAAAPAPLLLPGSGGAVAATCSPAFDPRPRATRRRLGPSRARRIRALFNRTPAAGDDRLFAARPTWRRCSATATRGSPAADLRPVPPAAPSNFADPRASRRLVTTHSFDLDRPGADAVALDPAAFPYHAWLPAPPVPARRRTCPSPPWAQPPAPPRCRPTASSRPGELAASLRRTGARRWPTLGRLDLNRQPADLPGARRHTGVHHRRHAGLPGRPGGPAAAWPADLFERLCAGVTGAVDPHRAGARRQRPGTTPSAGWPSWPSTSSITSTPTTT